MKNIFARVYNCQKFSVVEANKNKLENKCWLCVAYKLVLVKWQVKSDAGKNVKAIWAS